MNLMSSFICYFLIISFQQKNEIKKMKYSIGIQMFTLLREQMSDLFDVKDV